MPEAWRLPSLLRIHSEIDQIDQYLGVPLRLIVSTHHAEGKIRPVILEHHGWNKRMKRPLPGSDNVGMFRIELKQGPSVVEDDSCVAGHQTGTKGFKQAVDERHSIA